MRSDIIHVTNDGAGVQEALKQVERVAVYKDLPPKGALHLRLLAEEMLGLMCALTGEKEGDFWIDDEDREFRLHLKLPVRMNAEMRSKLLAVSSTGTNAAAKGVMGKLRDLLERMSEASNGEFAFSYAAGMYTPGEAAVVSGLWSLNRYKDSIDSETQTEEWDELEKSVVAKVADEVQIAIQDSCAEMIIYKKI